MPPFISGVLELPLTRIHLFALHGSGVLDLPLTRIHLLALHVSGVLDLPSPASTYLHCTLALCWSYPSSSRSGHPASKRVNQP